MADFERVKKLIVDQLNVEPEKVLPESSFVADLGADSLDLADLTMALEDEFDIEIPDDQVEKIQTVQNALDWINSSSGSGSS